MAKRDFTKIINDAEKSRFVKTEPRGKIPKGKKKTISLNEEGVRNYELTLRRYEPILDNAEFIVKELEKVNLSNIGKKKFLKNKKFYVDLQIILHSILTYQENITFDLQSRALSKIELSYLENCAKHLDRYLKNIYHILKEIDMRYYNAIISSLQDRINKIELMVGH